MNIISHKYHASRNVALINLHEYLYSIYCIKIKKKKERRKKSTYLKIFGSDIRTITRRKLMNDVERLLFLLRTRHVCVF